MKDPEFIKQQKATTKSKKIPTAIEKTVSPQIDPITEFIETSQRTTRSSSIQPPATVKKVSNRASRTLQENKRKPTLVSTGMSKRSRNTIQQDDDELAMLETNPLSRAFVLFTGMYTDDEVLLDEFKHLKNPISRLINSNLIERVHDWDQCSHLVTDKVRRTVKFLGAVSFST